ncbi:uncharacterized protein LOC129583222 [Paramacrobiotus metropolitanus]|uniref:uncharacterized protein LOC129583222 n=1 Tax=Paramacrobiotus metropolitanus TaxID=2943436 RepID=UPI0024458854|nr:uncharacterized protein LOC129583222 [Paramacrobiotus metropolitanus]
MERGFDRYRDADDYRYEHHTPKQRNCSQNYRRIHPRHIDFDSYRLKNGKLFCPKCKDFLHSYRECTEADYDDKYSIQRICPDHVKARVQTAYDDYISYMLWKYGDDFWFTAQGKRMRRYGKGGPYGRDYVPPVCYTEAEVKLYNPQRDATTPRSTRTLGQRVRMPTVHFNVSEPLIPRTPYIKTDRRHSSSASPSYNNDSQYQPTTSTPEPLETLSPTPLAGTRNNPPPLSIIKSTVDTMDATVTASPSRRDQPTLRKVNSKASLSPLNTTRPEVLTPSSCTSSDSCISPSDSESPVNDPYKPQPACDLTSCTMENIKTEKAGTPQNGYDFVTIPNVHKIKTANAPMSSLLRHFRATPCHRIQAENFRIP